MPLTRNQKVELGKEYQAILENVSGLYVFDYLGLTVEEVSELRNKVRETGATMQVVKNRMMKRAVADKPYAQIADILAGPNAIIFAGDDPVSPAKALVDFAKTNDKVEIRAGVIGDEYLDAAQVVVISKIPTQDELYAKLLGSVKAPASNILGCVKGLGNKLHGLMKAYVEKLEEAA